MEGKDTNVTTKAMTAEELEKKLSKEVGVEVDYSTITPANFIKFLVFSGLGVWVFFINTTIGGKTGTPMVLFIDWLKATLGSVKNWMTLVVCIALAVTFTLPRSRKRPPGQVPREGRHGRRCSVLSGRDLRHRHYRNAHL